MKWEVERDGEGGGVLYDVVGVLYRKKEEELGAASTSVLLLCCTLSARLRAA